MRAFASLTRVLAIVTVPVLALTASGVALAEDPPTLTPTIGADLSDGPPDRVGLNGWPDGAEVTIEVDLEHDGNIDITKTTIAPNGVEIGPDGTLQVGTFITATGAGIVKALTLVELRPEYLDPVSNVVAGVAVPGSTVLVHLNPEAPGPWEETQTAIAGIDGHWSVTFVTDFAAGRWFMVETPDEDGDVTTTSAQAQVPTIGGDLSYGPPDGVSLSGWIPGTLVFVEVDADRDGIFEITGNVVAPDWFWAGPDGTFQVGSVIRATGGGWVKDLTLVELRAEYVNPDTEVVAGVAPAGATVSVHVPPVDPGPWLGTQTVVADGSGRWTTSFTVDIVEGAWVHAETADPDGDLTSASTPAGIPWIGGSPGGGEGNPPWYAYLSGWTGGTPVTVTVDIDADGTPDYSESVVSTYFGPGIAGLDDVVTFGAVITATGGGWTKRVTLVPMSIDSVDLTGDVVTGTAPPDTPVTVEISQGGPALATREVWSDDTGAYTALFAGVFEIQPDHQVSAFVADDDGDRTTVGYEPAPFGIELYRYDPAKGAVGDLVGSEGAVAHGEWLWAGGSGFAPGHYGVDQCGVPGEGPVCRHTETSYQEVDVGEDGTFGVALQVGRNVMTPWDTWPQLWAWPEWDVRDGQTVNFAAQGLPSGGPTDCGTGACWVEARRWYDGSTTTSGPLDFGPDPGTTALGVQVTQSIAQLFWEEGVGGGIVVDQVPGGARIVDWDGLNGTISNGGYTVSRWVDPPADVGFSPPAPDHGQYDCADELAWDPDTGAAGSLFCALEVIITEGGEGIRGNWVPLHFAPFDLTASTTKAQLTSKPTGVALAGQVTCTGFTPEQYLVQIQGTVTQTTGGKRPTTVTSTFTTSTLCSGTMTNPQPAWWSAVTTGGFKTGTATVTLDVWSAGFTRTAYPLHVEQTIKIEAPSKRMR